MSLYQLLTWMSPSYPIGAFSHSGGLEWAVEAGFVRDRAGAQAWIGDMLAHGAGWNDCVFFVHAYRATRENDQPRLLEIATLAVAAQTSAERRLESTAQGAAFRRIASATASTPALGMLADIADEDLPYPVIAGCLMAGHDVPLSDGLLAYLHGLAANLVSAGQRLVPLGQTDAQLILAALAPLVHDILARALRLGDGDAFEEMRAAALMADFATMAHETQYTRLFRT
ncbi:MAG: urease accessory protein UreF [Alphaproteobacteria bacterium]